MNEKTARSIPIFLFRVILIHTITYYLFGLLASGILRYESVLSLPVIRDYMVGYGDPSVFWGPYIQPVRGLIIGLALLPMRGFFAQRKYGWLHIWLIFVGIGILSTPAAAPCSIEGVVYTRLPLWYHLFGMPEILTQTLVFSILTHMYMRHPTGIIETLPPVFSVLMKALSGACFSFIGYAVFSILFALSVNAEINASANLNLKVQGLFIAPFVFNFVIIALLDRLRSLRRMKRLYVFFLVWFFNSVLIGAYQQIVMDGASAIFVIAGPILPALIVTSISTDKPRS